MKPDLAEPRHTKALICQPQTYESQRAYFYDIETQLDHLYHDIQQGLFGPDAQQGRFFQYLWEIKQAIPKPKDSE